MEQALTSRLIALALSFVITSVLCESVVELGRPAGDGEVRVVQIAQVKASPPLR